MTIGDFWSWAHSDVMSNTNRSIFAEFLVVSALGLLDTPRIEWDAVDLHRSALSGAKRSDMVRRDMMSTMRA
jgi:hypothetical protein